jgi:hypothetical protein
MVPRFGRASIKPFPDSTFSASRSYGATDAIARHQTILAGEQIAGLQTAPDDVTAEHVHELLAEIAL